MDVRALWNIRRSRGRFPRPYSRGAVPEVFLLSGESSYYGEAVAVSDYVRLQIEMCRGSAKESMTVSGDRRQCADCGFQYVGGTSTPDHAPLAYMRAAMLYPEILYPIRKK